MPTTENLPITPDALTVEWLSSVLGRQVNAFRVQRFGEGAGLIGMVCRLHLDTAQGETSIIAKFPAPVASNRTVAETYNMYGREVQFYRDLAPRVALRTPRCHFAEFDAGSNDFVLLIEDLHGYRMGDQVAGCSAAEARTILAALAGLHASVWEPEDLDDVIIHHNAAQRDGMIAGFKVGWPACLERFPELIPAAARGIGERYPDNIDRLMREMCERPLCLIHGDVRIDNVFYADDHIALIDWQAVCRSAPEHDVAYFITQSVPRPVRDQQALLEGYQTELCRALAQRGVEYDLELSRSRYRVAALYLLSYAVVIAGTLDMGNARGVELARNILDGSLSALDELDAFALLR